MNRYVERTRKLPAFSIGLGELEVWWNRMIAVFGPGEPVSARIIISLQSEELEFGTPDELRNYAGLKGRVTKFSLHFFQGSRILNVFCHGSLANPVPYVFARGETEAWPAGAVETVYSFLQSYRLWYHWFVHLSVGVFIIVLMLVTSGLNLLLPQAFPWWVALGWLSMLLTFAALHMARAILLPSSVLRITNEKGFVRRHISELSLVVALLSPVLVVAGWFFGK